MNIAIIPVRTGSKRLPRKNLLELGGRPLFVHAIEHARDSELFDEIHVSTESEEVVGICRDFGLEVAFKRTDALANDTAKLVDVCKYTLKEFDARGRRFDSFCMLWATNPLRTADDVVESYRLLDVDTDAVVGVAEFDLPVFSALTLDSGKFLSPLFPDMMWRSSQAMPLSVACNGSLCWCKTDALFEHNLWIPPRSRPYLMPRSRSVDLETAEDWDYVQYLFNRSTAANSRVEQP